MSSRLGDYLKIGQGRTSGTSFLTQPRTLLARPLQVVSFGDRPSAPARGPGGGRAWRRRQVVVAFDSNVATNAKGNEDRIGLCGSRITPCHGRVSSKEVSV